MSRYYTEISALDFYSTIFPPDTLERKGDLSHRASNPIFSFKVRHEDGRTHFQNEIVFADHFEETLAKTTKNDFALCSMISYSGRRKSAKNAFKCHGFIIDLDGVEMPELESFWGWVEELKKIPYPSFVANSGYGLHIYYLFENPVPLYPQVAQHLQALKRGLTDWVWNKETSNHKVSERQYQGIYQSFRMVGSRTKLGNGTSKNKYLVKAWKTGKPVTIEYLNSFVEDEFKCPENPDYSSWEWKDEEHHSLSECQELYPDWYERRIIKGEPSGQWKCSKGLYDWWLGKIQEGAKDGTRYNCVAMLYVYGVKCMIDKSFVDADAMALLEPFNELTTRPDNEFTVEDIIGASKFYDTKYSKMGRAEIQRRTGIRIDKARRNNRKQSEHLFRTRIMRVAVASYENVGRPDKKTIVEEWRKKNPNGKKAECIRDTGLSKPTVLKWWV